MRISFFRRFVIDILHKHETTKIIFGVYWVK